MTEGTIIVRMSVFGVDISIPARFDAYISQLPMLMFLVSMEGPIGTQKLFDRWTSRVRKIALMKKNEPKSLGDELEQELIQRSLAVSLLGNIWMNSPSHIDAEWDVMAEIDAIKKSRGIESYLGRLKNQFIGECK